MSWKAVGLETCQIYAIGTHAECSRAVNRLISNTGEERDAIGRHAVLRHTETIRIMRDGEKFETDAEYLERMEKEMLLMGLSGKHPRENRSTPVHQVSWTDEKDEWLMENAGTTNVLNRFNEKFGESASASAIHNRTHKLRNDRDVKIVKNRLWSRAEDAYLVEHYYEETADWLASTLKRTRDATVSRIALLKRKGLRDYWRTKRKER